MLLSFLTNRVRLGPNQNWIFWGVGSGFVPHRPIARISSQFFGTSTTGLVPCHVQIQSNTNRAQPLYNQTSGSFWALSINAFYVFIQFSLFVELLKRLLIFLKVNF